MPPLACFLELCCTRHAVRRHRAIAVVQNAVTNKKR
jgi:hypothetical protein